MRERDIEKILVREVKNLGGRAYKFTSPGNNGVPDRIVCFPDGRLAFVELKAKGGRPTKQQLVQMRRLRDLGQTVYLSVGIPGVARFFREMGYPRTAKRIEVLYGGDI